MARSFLIFTALAAFLLSAGFLHAQSLTCGGYVLKAADATPAGLWEAYEPADPTSKARGQVGAYRANYWAGEVGHIIGPLAPGDDLVVVMEKEVNAATLEHKGYYAVTGGPVGVADPASFPQTQLRLIPSPSVSIAGSGVRLDWQAAQEDVAGNIVGYNLYRSADGISFDSVNAAPITDLGYVDTEFDGTTNYYALGLVFRGSSPVNGTALSANSNPGQVIDTDDDSLSDILELASGMNNTNPDSDGDVIPDGWEVRNGLDPLVDDAELDPDEDGISNYDEYANGYDPALAAPTATITVTPDSGPPPLAVVFGYIATGNATSVLWNFGDGTTSTETNPSHTFVDAGRYNVTLAMTGPGGVSVSSVDVNCSNDRALSIVPVIELLLE